MNTTHTTFIMPHVILRCNGDKDKGKCIYYERSFATIIVFFESSSETLKPHTVPASPLWLPHFPAQVAAKATTEQRHFNKLTHDASEDDDDDDDDEETGFNGDDDDDDDTEHGGRW